MCHENQDCGRFSQSTLDHYRYANYLQARLNRNAYLKMKEANPSSDIDLFNYVERRIGFKEIGSRNILGNNFSNHPYQESGKPFFIFYEDPVIVIECESKDRYREIRNQIETDWFWRLYDAT